jgi:hypothetical protein
MKHDFTKLAILAIVIIAFIDGILVAQSLQSHNAPDTTAAEGIILEDVFPVREVNSEHLNDVPFTVQAPLGWTAPWTDYAEEATLYMAIQWAKGERSEPVAERIQSIQAIAADLPVQQNLENIQTYLFSQGFSSQLSATVTQAVIEQELQEGNLIILPINGQILDSPYYADPAPEEHMILLVGYDEGSFIVNDPGTVRGNKVSYEKNAVIGASMDLNGEKRMLIFEGSK